MADLNKDRDDDTDHGDPEPPLPVDLPPAVAYGIRMQAWGLARIVRAIDKLPTEAAQVRRHTELRADINWEM